MPGPLGRTPEVPTNRNYQRQVAVQHQEVGELACRRGCCYPSPYFLFCIVKLVGAYQKKQQKKGSDLEIYDGLKGPLRLNG